MRTLPRLGLALLLALAGCTSSSPLACPTAAPDRAARVFFATDRKKDTAQTASANGLQFGNDRTEPPALQMGWEKVTLGPQHRRYVPAPRPERSPVGRPSVRALGRTTSQPEDVRRW